MSIHVKFTQAEAASIEEALGNWVDTCSEDDLDTAAVSAQEKIKKVNEELEK